MQIDVPFEDDNLSLLRGALGRDDVDEIAAIVARAGAAEALALATGRAVFSTMSDLRLYRIFSLIREGMSLRDAERLIAQIFKVPVRTAARWVQQAFARYAVDLRKSVEAGVSETLEAASWDDDKQRWNVAMPDVWVRDALLGALATQDLPTPAVTDRGSTWSFADESFQFARKRFGLGHKDY
jgi:hypothetical protein